jgi:hypothetical protein
MILLLPFFLAAVDSTIVVRFVELEHIESTPPTWTSQVYLSAHSQHYCQHDETKRSTGDEVRT